MKKCLAILGIGLMLIIAGCTTVTESGGNGDRFSTDGLPHEQYLVGGGLEIQYCAPCDGTAILIDYSLKRYIATGHLSQGEVFEWDYDTNPIVLATPINLRLYFIPDNPVDGQ